VNPPLVDVSDRHRTCWYGRRTADMPAYIGFHTIEDGLLLFCAHPMWFPVVGYHFDVRSCAACDYFKARISRPKPE